MFTREQAIANVQKVLADYVGMLPAGVTVEECRVLCRANRGRGVQRKSWWWDLAYAIVACEQQLADLAARK